MIFIRFNGNLMSDKNEQNWGNYWQGRRASEALVGVGVEHSTQLAQFWKSSFKGLKAETKVLDMACGAGAVLRHAHDLGINNLTGVDISKDAIKTMQAGLPTAVGVVSTVDNTGLTERSYDIVVSQFGFEYAGNDDDVLSCASEMARLIAPSGQFTALCHIVGGSIEQEVEGHLNDIAAIKQTGFIEAAKDVFTMAFAAEKHPGQESKLGYEKAVQNLAMPRDKLVAWIGEQQGASEQTVGLATHLYNGTLEMFSRRKAYSADDITGWLDGVAHEMQAYKGRMASMKQAALNKPQAAGIMNVFSEAGFSVEPPKTLSLETSGAPAAWILRAIR